MEMVDRRQRQMNAAFTASAASATTAFVSALLLLQLTAAEGVTMCIDEGPVLNPSELTSYDYPSFVLASQCQCTVIPVQSIDEFHIRIALKRNDQSTDCSRTRVTIAFRNSSNFVCPVKLGSRPSTDGGIQAATGVTTSMSMTPDDRVVVTLWNTHSESISAYIGFSSDHPATYTVICKRIENDIEEAGFMWLPDDVRIAPDDGVDSRIKTAVVVLYLILAFAISVTMRIRTQFNSNAARRKKRRAKKKLIDQTKQVVEFYNLGMNFMPSEHSLSNDMHFYGGEQIFVAGHGGIWPMENGLYLPANTLKQRASSDTLDGLSQNKNHVEYDRKINNAGEEHNENPIVKQLSSNTSPLSHSQERNITDKKRRSFKPNQRNNKMSVSTNHSLGVSQQNMPKDEVQHAKLLSSEELASVHQIKSGGNWQKRQTYNQNRDNRFSSDVRQIQVPLNSVSKNQTNENNGFVTLTTGGHIPHQEDITIHRRKLSSKVVEISI